MKKKQNILIYSGAGIFFCTLITYTLLNIFSPNKISSISRIQNIENVYIFLILILLIGPIIEEFIFRGYFYKKEFFKYFFYIGSLLYIVFTQNYYLLLLLVTIAFFDFYLQKGAILVYFLNSLLFALVHYKLKDFENIYNIIPVFFQFGMGLVLIWVVINFGLVKSIFLHFFVNLIIITPILFVLQYPDQQRHVLQSENLIIEWEKTSLFGTTQINYSEKELMAKRVSIDQLLLNFTNKSSPSRVNDSIKMFKYNFKILNKENKKVDTTNLFKLLHQAKLIEK